MSSDLLLSKVDALVLDDHYHVDSDDNCYFLWEYNAGEGFAFSESNRLILNLKKGVEKRTKYEWRYKLDAIERSARGLASAASNSKWDLRGWILVPAPPSKTKSHELYDDRLVQVAQKIGRLLSVEVLELLENRLDREPQHATKAKRDVNAKITNLRFNRDAISARPRPTGIVIVDDVLTSGATFAACKAVIERNIPGVPVVGLFIARRVPQPEDLGFDDGAYEHDD